MIEAIRLATAAHLEDRDSPAPLNAARITYGASPKESRKK